ncbi:MAG: hypothetical protein JW889_16995 [Verrucomicrobia bacterium]|nr:hypothetical protein [Verrucomicrobiota bacterium]
MVYCRVLALVAAFLLCAQHVHAQSDEARSGARAAASQGIKAFNEGRWAEAVDLMTRAEALVHAPTHLLYLAQAEEKQGHLVKAHEAYLKITREKLATNAPDAFKKAQAEAERLLEALEPRLPFVNVVALPEGAVELSVTMDGTPVPGVLVGVAHPVDPGEHTFKATATGMESDLVTVTLAEGEQKNVELTLRPSGTASPAGTNDAGSTGGATTGGGGSGQMDQPKAGGMSPWTIVGFSGLGLGAAGVVVGTLFAIDSADKRSQADAICATADRRCPADRADEVTRLDDDADSSNVLAVTGFVIGGVGVVGGLAALWYGANDDTTAQSGVRPYFGLGTLGVTGRF